MKTAFVYWEDRIAPVFDTAQRMFVVEMEAGQIVGEKQADLVAEPPVQKVLQLVNQKIETLVCGAISRPLQAMIAAYGIRVIAFVAGDLREVVQAWAKGELKNAAFCMPGCTGRGGGRRRGRCEEYGAMKGKSGRGRGPGAGCGQGQAPGGRSAGRGGVALGVGPVGYCVCPQCGEKAPYERGKPCTEHTCPQCGVAMVRDPGHINLP